MAKLENDFDGEDDSIELDIDEEVIRSGTDTIVNPLDDSFDATEILEKSDTAQDPMAQPQDAIETIEKSDMVPDPMALLPGKIEQMAVAQKEPKTKRSRAKKQKCTSETAQ